LREENRLKVFENTVLRRTEDKLTGEWKWHVWGERRVAYRVLVGKPEGRISFGIPRHKWDDNIRMGIHEVG